MWNDVNPDKLVIFDVVDVRWPDGPEGDQECLIEATLPDGTVFRRWVKAKELELVGEA